VVEQFMVKGDSGGQDARTVPVTIEEPVLVVMSAAERSGGGVGTRRDPHGLVDQAR
jgi:hypothetical protein